MLVILEIRHFVIIFLFLVLLILCQEWSASGNAGGNGIKFLPEKEM
jgi:hypothetical protein